MKAAQEALSTVEKAMRDTQAKADAIDAAVYDLKAVNPLVRVEKDTRSVPEILDSIAKQNQVMVQALERLRSMI